MSKTPGVRGGDACIRHTRITVWGLVEQKRLGFTEERILEGIPGLTPEDLRVAWEDGAANPDEIERSIAENEAA